jgi:hypothetical protein
MSGATSGRAGRALSTSLLDSYRENLGSAGAVGSSDIVGDAR